MNLHQKKFKNLKELREVKLKLRKSCLSTVCEEARCPNIAQCFTAPAATFLILGDICTRSCRFCSIKKGQPQPPDENEPENVANAALELGLSHVVITSVTRDDLEDKGAGAFAKTVHEIKRLIHGATVEVLTPDFSGSLNALEIVLASPCDVFNHNVETVERLYPEIRPLADIGRSLKLLSDAKKIRPSIITKTGFMVGLGENEDEIAELLQMICASDVDIVTIGQYMQPTKEQAPVKKIWPEDRFASWALLAKNIGIRYCISGPFVRSSYQAKEALNEIKRQRGTLKKLSLPN